MNNIFLPKFGALSTISATNSSSSVTVSANSGNNIVVRNLGTATVFIRWGYGAQTAVTTDFPLIAGEGINLRIDSTKATTVAAITASSTATVYVSPGSGEFQGVGLGSGSTTVSGTVTVTGDVNVEGVYSDDDTAANPVCGGALCRTSDMAAASNNNNVTFVADQLRKLLVRPYALPSSTWAAVLDTAITDTTSTAVKAAGGSTTKYYITAATISNAHATVGTDVLILSATTKLWIVPAKEVYGGACITFPTPLPCGVNEAINFQPKTTGASIKGAVAGFSETIA